MLASPRRVACAVVLIVHLSAASLSIAETPEEIRQEALSVLRPYEGGGPDDDVPVVDRATLSQKVMAGYQGWFTAEGDGSGRGWFHYSQRGEFRPGRCSIDLWPDVSELTPHERYATQFRQADGQVAEVFSSYNRETVLRHFRWMADYGIDGVFLQRFTVETQHPTGLRHCNVVLSHVRDGANRAGRCYAVMYDLSGLQAGGVDAVIDDCKQLHDRMLLGRDGSDHAYLKHHGKPVVAVWGIGFGDGRRYSLADCDRLITFLKSDPTYGGNTVLVGVPTGWRTLDRDAIDDRNLHATLQKADIICPWTVGRYATPAEARRHAVRDWKQDIVWCDERGIDYLPVVFPGFSWHNLKRNAPLDQIPRRKGEFLWSQFVEAKGAGANMLYVAMFDEIDEGTAIFKCTNDVPVGASPFLTYEGLPSDHYLWLTGQGGKMLRNEISVSERLPTREK